MQLFELDMLEVEGKEVMACSYEIGIGKNAYKIIVETDDEYGKLQFQGQINEELALVLVRFKEYYRENMRKKPN